MDIFDEFEMKPLTDGLGFHRKKLESESNELHDVHENSIHEKKITTSKSSSEVNTKDSIDRATEALDKLMSSLSNLDKKGISFSETLPSNFEKQSEASSGALNPNLNTLNRNSIHPVVKQPIEQTPFIDKPIYDEAPMPGVIVPKRKKSLELKENKNEKIKKENIGVQRGASDSLKRQLLKTSVSIPSAIVDTLVIFAIGLLFLVGMLLFTGTELDVLISSIVESTAAKSSIALLFLSVLIIYVTVSRTFTACTLGEWAFDCQLGTNEQANSPIYPVRVAFRSIFTILTGVIVLPILSLVINRDIAGLISGLNLYKKNY